MPYTTWPPKQDPATNYTEQPVCIVSKENMCQVWAGAKIMFSGLQASGYEAASGYNFWSGECDVSPVNASGWGHIRVPELGQVHAAIIVPKVPCIQAAINWQGPGQCSGNPKSGIGGISGNVMLVHYCDTTVYHQSGPFPARSGAHSVHDYALSGWGPMWMSGCYASGVVDVFAFGSKY